MTRRYLPSNWDATRKEAYARAGYRCSRCHRRGKLHAHHATYERLGHERAGDLVVLCPWHHWLMHPWRSTRGMLRQWIPAALLLAFAGWVLYGQWGIPGVLIVTFVGLMIVKAGRKFRG